MAGSVIHRGILRSGICGVRLLQRGGSTLSARHRVPGECSWASVRRRRCSTVYPLLHSWHTHATLHTLHSYRLTSHDSHPAVEQACSSNSTSGGGEVDASGLPHVPVLLEQVLSSFQPIQMGVYVDGTLGAAGHACAVMAEHPELQTVVGIDQDPTALDIAEAKLASAAAGRGEAVRLKLVKSNFMDMKAVLEREGLAARGVDAILMDLGMSSMQVDSAERGFSFMNDGPLDMRMDPDGTVTAADIVNSWSEQRLGQIFRDYGEEKYWRQFAKRICAARESSPISTTLQLADAVGPPIFHRGGGKGSKKGRSIHPATRVFQALRIVVNDELLVVEKVIPNAIDCLAPGGRLGIITFHSLEDRIVKKAFLAAAGRAPSELTGLEAKLRLELADANEAARVRLITRKPMSPSDEEIASNPRSRSAKLRVVEKL